MRLSDAIRTSYRLGVCCPEGTWRCLLLLVARVIQPKRKPRVSPRTEKSANLAQIYAWTRERSGQSNRSQRWSASRTRLAMAFSNCTLTGTRCVAIRVLRKLSPRSHRSSRKTDYACLFSPACDAARNWNASKLMNAATQSQANQSPVRA